MLSCIYCGKKLIGFQEKYCSEAHRKQAWKKRNWRRVLNYNNAWARKKARLDWVKKLCLFCNKQFLPPLGNKYAIYCSTNCRVKANYRKSVESGRKKINSAKFREVHRLEIQKHDEEYKARIRFGTSSKTLNKEIVLKRDNKICRMCKRNSQVIHHILYSGKPEDLVCLCRACHARIHQQIKQPPYWPTKWHFFLLNAFFL